MTRDATDAVTNQNEDRIIAVVTQQFLMRISCSIFLYRNSFGANQRLALTRKSFRIAQVSHCAVQRVQQSANVL